MSTPEKNSKQIYFVELFRMIRSSKLLFISITAVCALSVAAFCGASFTKDAANVLTREFYTESIFSDLKIQCPLGFEESDTDVVKEDSDVKEAETGLWTHKYIDGGERKIIAEFFTKQENINKPNLMEGFLPEKEDECAIELEFSELLGLKVGDKISILADASPLVYTEFRITGIVTLPQIFLKNMPDVRGVSSIGNGEISTLILVDKTAFEEETVPNIMYIVLDRSVPFFTDEYEQYVDLAKNRIAVKGANVVIKRFSDSSAEYYSDLEEAEKEYEDSYAKYTAYLEEYNDLVERIEKLSSVSATNSFSDKLESSKEKLDDAEFRLKKADGAISFLRKTIETIESGGGWIVSDSLSNASFSYYNSTGKNVNTILFTIGSLFVLVALIVSFATVSRLVSERRVLIGMQKALGMSVFEISLKYILFTMISSLLGIIAGAFLSYFSIEKILFRIVYWDYFYYTEFRPYFSVVPILVIGFLMILSCLIATFLACHVIVREQAATLISGASKGGHFGKSVKSRFPPLGLVIAVRNTILNFSVSAATFSGVCGCVFLIVVALIARFSVSDMKDVQFGELQDYDYVAYVDKDASYSDRSAFDSYLYNYKVISSICINERKMTVNKNGKLIYTTALLCDKKDISPFVKLIDSKTGEPLSVPNEGVLVSENMAVTFGYHVGDSICLNDSFGRSCETVISGIFKRNVGYALVISPDVYKSVTGEIADLSQYYIKIYRVNRDNFISGMYEYPAFIGITSTDELGQRVTDMTNSLDKIVFIMVVYALLLAVFVIFNLAIMNINRKRNELAIMVSLGTPMKKVFMASVSDNLIVSFLALITGSVFGYLGGSFIVSNMRFENFMLVRDMGIDVILLGVLICIVFVALANVCSLVKVRKINITELTRCE